jgi:hypothetical protein
MIDLRTRIAMAMRETYGKITGENVNMIPFAVAKSRDSWLACADAALRVIREEETAK